jgi:SAM-dependent methyltransferase
MKLIDKLKLKIYLAFKTNKWSCDNDFIKRKYKSYDSYLLHQKSKLPLLYDELKEKNKETVENFCKRFELCNIKKKSDVLCLGARIGSEVEALRKLGHFAVGIDLNPGPENLFVTYGDFHKLAFSDNSVDVIYCNCLDHIYNLEYVLNEIVRVLKEDGMFILDIIDGYAEDKKASVFDSFHWKEAKDFAFLIEEKSSLKINAYRNLKQAGEPKWNQVIFRKEN